MRALVDQQLPVRLVVWLEARGVEAWHVKRLGLAGADGSVVWREAVARNAMIITKDADFRSILQARPGPFVIWLRFGNCSNAELLLRLERAWPAILKAFGDGVKLVEVT